MRELSEREESVASEQDLEDTYLISWRSGYVLCRMFGEVELLDVVNSNDDLTSDERFDDIKGMIFDFSSVDSLQLTDMDIRIVAAMGKAAPNYNRRRLRVGYIAVSEDVTRKIKLAIDRYFHREWDRQIFDDYNSALEWVDL